MSDLTIDVCLRSDPERKRFAILRTNFDRRKYLRLDVHFDEQSLVTQAEDREISEEKASEKVSGLVSGWVEEE